MAGSKPSRRASRTCSQLPFSRHQLQRMGSMREGSPTPAPCLEALPRFSHSPGVLMFGLAIAAPAGAARSRLRLQTAVLLVIGLKACVIGALQIVLDDSRDAIDSTDREVLVQHFDAVLPAGR